MQPHPRPNPHPTPHRQALVLIHFLAKQRQAPASRWRADPKDRRVLELGAGTGAAGLAAGALGAARVLLTDRPHLMQLLESNIVANGMGGVASAVPYEWGEPFPAEMAGDPWDLILLSDVIYEPEGSQPLIDTISLLLGGGGSAAAGAGAAAANGHGEGGEVASSNGGSIAAVAAATTAAAASAPAGSGAAGAVATAASPSPTVVLAVELRVDLGIAQFVRQLVSRGYFVDRVSCCSLCFAVSDIG
jgi:hypothetical protein